MPCPEPIELFEGNDFILLIFPLAIICKNLDSKFPLFENTYIGPDRSPRKERERGRKKEGHCLRVYGAKKEEIVPQTKQGVLFRLFTYGAIFEIPLGLTKLSSGDAPMLRNGDSTCL